SSMAYKTKLNDLGEAVEDAGEAHDETAKAIEAANEVLAEHYTNQHKLADALELVADGMDAEAAAREVGMDASILSAELDRQEIERKHELSEAHRELVDAVDGYAASSSEFSGALEAAGISSEQFAAKLEQQGLALDDVKGDFEAYIDSVQDGFDRLETDSEKSLSAFQDTLANNTALSEEWGANLEYVLTTAGSGMSSGFIAELRRGGVEEYSQLLRDMNGLSQEELLAIGAEWDAAGMSAAEDFKLGLDPLPEDVAVVIADMGATADAELAVVTDTWEQSGQDAKESYAGGLAGISDWVADAAAGVPDAMGDIGGMSGDAYAANAQSRISAGNAGIGAVAAQGGAGASQGMAAGIVAGLSAVDSAMSMTASMVKGTAGAILLDSEGGRVVASLAQGMSQQLHTVTSAVAAIRATVAGGMSATVGEAHTLGAAIGYGVARGISSTSGAIASAARSAASAAMASAKAQLDIHSPSGRARREIGQMWSRGTELGILDRVRNIRAAASTAMDATMVNVGASATA
ncbi:MAG: hypothetical protein GX025_10660, partial [Clostridiales bacterium]|nr:hypothetical protein [Clostridiales bacterium]